MIFNAELIGIKTLADGATRITFDIPKVDQSKVLSSITGFMDKALMVEVELSDNLEILKKLRKDAFFALDMYAKSKKLKYEDLHNEILASDKLFPGKNYTSLKELSILEIRELIRTVNDLLGGK